MIPGPSPLPSPSTGRSETALTIALFTYNRSALLAKALRAFQAQIAQLGTTDVEVVVSDNASTDDTEAVARSFAGRLPSFQYFRQSSNVGALRNYLQAVKLARGRFVWPFSDDDIPADGMVGRMRDRALQDPAKFWLGNFSRYSASTGAVIIDRTLSLDKDVRFSSILGLAARVGLYDALTLVSIAIFERERFLAVDHEAFLSDETWFGHVYMLLAAFAGQECALLAEPIVYQSIDEARWRKQWRDTHGRNHLYLHTIGTLNGVRRLRERGIVPSTFLTDVQEPELVSVDPRVETVRSTAVALIRYLANFVALESAEQRSLSAEEWQLIHQEFGILNRPDLLLMVRQINFAAERLRLQRQLYEADIALLNQYLSL
ncbi:MAG: glycosyltransferase family 2 protein [Alphaproteobacteria bacterium]|nr:glycosyltransferase family 2 protein [Alphaproteobacteria bacterium]